MQPSLLTKATDTTVKLPSNPNQVQVVRDTAAPGAGKYYAYDENGVKELIGGPGAGSGIPFGNDTDVLPNVIQVAIVGAALTDGYTFEVNILTSNTGATTLQTNALGVKNVVDSEGNPLVGGELINESIYLFAYDLQNDRYQLMGLAKPGPVELWIPGTGLESARLKSTLGPNTASGNYSVAEGSDNTASGVNSHVEGNSNFSTGIASHAEGIGTTSSGTTAHSEGNTTVASGDNSHAEGRQTLASGLESHAEGNGTIASAWNAHAEGNSTTASFQFAHAEGQATLASNEGSHAEGVGSTSSGYAAHAEGAGSTAAGDQSHAEGNSTQSVGVNSHAEGNLSLASGDNSHAEGASCTASGENAHAEGNGTTSSGPGGSHSEGSGTLANANAAHAEGDNTVASGQSSHSENQNTIASGENSHAGGRDTISTGVASFNHSRASIAGLSNVIGDYSAILGGVNNNVDATSLRSVALGGTANNIVDESDTVQVPELRVTKNVKITQGANKAVGTSAAMVAGSVTVANTLVKTGAIILLTAETPGGVQGVLSAPIASIINATSFVINSSNAADTSTVNYLIINP